MRSETAVRNRESFVGKWRGREERGDEDGRLHVTESDEERTGESEDVATGCTRDSLPEGIVY